ncbi:MAG: hypothetical protein AMJ75_08955 [Phycisphaerae bacterium SM1_79]|nr:MAG: hypothetical protein AMJ75_08955 [Phycisphaerae bacterium SM1_79]
MQYLFNGIGPYYWRIDEDNTDGTLTEGGIWNFMVGDFILVDDFEPYDANDNQIWYAWNDGLGTELIIMDTPVHIGLALAGKYETPGHLTLQPPFDIGVVVKIAMAHPQAACGPRGQRITPA